MKTIGLALLLSVFLSISAYADDLTAGQIVALQNNGSNSVLLTLTGDPLLGPTSAGSGDFDLSFEAAVIAPSTTSTWSFTLTFAGGSTFTSTHSGMLSCGSTCILFQSFTLPPNMRHPILGTLTFTFNGVSSGALPFRFVEPVPEPNTLALLVGGVGVLGWRKYRQA